MEADKFEQEMADGMGASAGNAQSPDNDDIKSQKAAKKRTLLVTLCILITEMGERVTYYSIVANIIMFGKSKLEYYENDLATLNQIFSGCVYLIPIAGGFISDSFLGRFKTIVSFGFVYIVGISLVLASSIEFAQNINVDQKRVLFIAGLACVALGTGGIKSNVGPFGAEQLESLGKEAVQSFFNWFYWVVNIGALIAFSGVSYIQQEISFGWGYFVPFVSMILSLALFISMKNKYLRTEPKGSILSEMCSIFGQGCCKGTPEPNPALPPGTEKKTLARAKVSFGGDHKDNLVDGVSSAVRLIPFCLLLIIYWTVYSQMANTFFVQGTRMDVRLRNGANVPVALLNIFNTITIILLIPIVDRVVYPFFVKINRPISYLKRIGIGMVLAALALFVAGFVEIERKRQMEEPGGSHIQVLSGKNYTSSSMSIFVQVPQFALIGISEIFTSITSLEFVYNQTPVAMQGLLTGLMLAASGFGSLLSSALLVIVEQATQDDPWWGPEINDTKMENLLFLIGVMMMVNLLVFCIVSHFYTYQDPSTFESQNSSKIENASTSLVSSGQKDSQTTEKITATSEVDRRSSTVIL